VRFHDARHTHATELLRAGVHPKVVSEQLGYSFTYMASNSTWQSKPAMVAVNVRDVAAPTVSADGIPRGWTDRPVTVILSAPNPLIWPRSTIGGCLRKVSTRTGDAMCFPSR
jgi:hypothetical protein